MLPHLIWDWNGTLLNDVDVCIQAINRLLSRRGLSEMTRERYREVFAFPVKSYYEIMGFDFARESFSDVAVEFHAAYEELVSQARLHDGVAETLERAGALGFRQAVLSALEEQRLRNELRIRGIDHHFVEVFGLADLHAHSKMERGRELIAELETPAENCWMIGDTGHDAEVAGGMGTRCILVSCGHHSARRLRATGSLVAESPSAALAAVASGGRLN